VQVGAKPGVWPCLADPDQLEVALLNLVLNARDAMPKGGVTRVESRNVAFARQNDTPPATELKPGEYVAITVSDRGVGIPAAHRDKVFEPFFTTKEVGRGSGLGLSQVQGFAKQSGGDVTVDSVEAGGTTVTMYLPRAM